MNENAPTGEGDDPREITTITYSELGSPYTSYCLLCEEATPLADGAVNLSRIVNQWSIRNTSLPVAIQFWIAIGFKGLPPGEDNPVRLLFINEDTLQVVSMNEPAVRSDTHDLNYFVEVERFPVYSPGPYRLSVVYGDREIGRYPFIIDVSDTDPAETPDPPSGHVTK